jgi:hypothetical protein
LAQTHSPVNASTTCESIEEAAIVGAIRLNASIAAKHSFAERHEVSWHSGDDFKQVFVIS